MASRPPPSCLSFILCERAIHDRYTGQHSVIGIVVQVLAKDFPAVSAPLTVFGELTGGHGPIRLRFDVMDLDEARPPIMVAEVGLTFHDPRTIHQFSLHMAPMQFPEPGLYRVRLQCEGEFVADRRLLLSRAGSHDFGPDTPKPPGIQMP